jgi:hypothetical protein
MQGQFPALTRLMLDCFPIVSTGVRFWLFPFSSQADMLSVCKLLSYIASHFPRCPNFFCLQLNLSASPFGRFRIPGTFHPRRWSRACSRWPTRIAHHSFSIPEFLPRSKISTPTSLDTPCPPGSQGVSANTWRTSFLRLTLLYSTPFT